MPVMVSPGLYDREIDLSLYTPAVSSLVVGMVIAAKAGPLNEATLITTEKEFIDTFGTPLTSHFGGLAAIQALKEADKIYIVRTASDQGADAVARASVKIFNGGAAAVVTGSAAGPFTVSGSNGALSIKVNGEAAQTVTLTTGTRTAAQVAADINAAVLGLTVTVDGTEHLVLTTLQDGTAASIEFVATSNDAYTLLGLSVGTTYGTNAAAVGAVTPDSGAGPFDTDPDHTLTVQVGANDPVTITLTSGAAVTHTTIIGEINAAGDGVGGTATGFVATSVTGNKLKITAKPDADGFAPDLTVGGNAATVLAIAGTTSGTDAESLPSLLILGKWWGSQANDYSVQIERDPLLDKFTLSIYNQGVLVEKYQNAVKDTTDTDFYVETQVNGNQGYIVVDDQATNVKMPKNGTYTLVDGADGLTSLSDADYVGVASDASGKPTGLQIFTNVDEYDALSVICVPGVSSTPVIGEMMGICEARGDMMCLIDPPFGLSAQDVGKWMDGRDFGNTVAVNSNYAATYWSWVEWLDAYSGLKIWTPPVGHMLRVYAYNDKVAEPWFAPAGYNRGIIRGPVTNIEVSPSKGSRDVLFGTPGRINPIVKTREGIVCLGDKTSTTKPSALDAINVRRLLIYIKKAFRLSVKFLLFEPNDPATMTQLIQITKPMLADIAGRRGLRDFDVICDESINTAEVTNRKELHANIFLKPTLPVRTILLNYIITRQDAVFSEIQI